MDYSITLNEFINRVNQRISEEIGNGMNFGHVNYSAYIDSDSLLEATNSCSDGSEQICSNIKKKLSEKLKSNKDINSFKVDEVKIIVKPQEDLTNYYFTVAQRNHFNKSRKYVQVKVGFKKQIYEKGYYFIKSSSKEFRDILYNKKSGFEQVKDITRACKQNGIYYPNLSSIKNYIRNNYENNTPLETIYFAEPAHELFDEVMGADFVSACRNKRICCIYFYDTDGFTGIYGYIIPEDEIKVLK